MINDDDANGINLGNFTLKSCAEYIQKVVSSSLRCVFCKILDHEGNEITVDQLVEKYYSFGNKGSDDDQETVAKQGSVGQTESSEERSEPKNEKSDQGSTGSDLGKEATITPFLNNLNEEMQRLTQDRGRLPPPSS
jgi:hypothetical protein